MRWGLGRVKNFNNIADCETSTDINCISAYNSMPYVIYVTKTKLTHAACYSFHQTQYIYIYIYIDELFGGARVLRPKVHESRDAFATVDWTRDADRRFPALELPPERNKRDTADRGGGCVRFVDVLEDRAVTICAQGVDSHHVLFKPYNIAAVDSLNSLSMTTLFGSFFL